MVIKNLSEIYILCQNENIFIYWFRMTPSQLFGLKTMTDTCESDRN